jgi:four helix bundle protein
MRASSRFDFELYRCAPEFRKSNYMLIRRLPVEEKYALGSQMRRAAISITNNLAEGHGRWYYQDNIRFCRISRGSVGEIIDDPNICMDENYAGEQELMTLKESAHALIARINSYIAYLRRSKQGDDSQ